jgi:hypothetical protein
MEHLNRTKGRQAPAQKNEAPAAATAQGFESSTKRNQHCTADATRRATTAQTRHAVRQCLVDLLVATPVLIWIGEALLRGAAA